MVDQWESKEENTCGCCKNGAENRDDMIIDLTRKGWKEDESEIIGQGRKDGCLWSKRYCAWYMVQVRPRSSRFIQQLLH